MMGGGSGTYGRMAQAANPQGSDPMQNLNNSGFPNARRVQPTQMPMLEARDPRFFPGEPSPSGKPAPEAPPQGSPYERGPQPIPYQIDPAKMPNRQAASLQRLLALAQQPQSAGGDQLSPSAGSARGAGK